MYSIHRNKRNKNRNLSERMKTYRIRKESYKQIVKIEGKQKMIIRENKAGDRE